MKENTNNTPYDIEYDFKYQFNDPKTEKNDTDAK